MKLKDIDVVICPLSFNIPGRRIIPSSGLLHDSLECFLNRAYAIVAAAVLVVSGDEQDISNATAEGGDLSF